MLDVYDGILVFDGSVVGVDDVCVFFDVYGVVYYGVVGVECDGVYIVDGVCCG